MDVARVKAFTDNAFVVVFTVEVRGAVGVFAVIGRAETEPKVFGCRTPFTFPFLVP